MINQTTFCIHFEDFPANDFIAAVALVKKKKHDGV